MFREGSQDLLFYGRSSHALVLAVSGAAFTGNVHLGGGPFLGQLSSFSYTNLTLQSRLCSPAIIWNLFCPYASLAQLHNFDYVISDTFAPASILKGSTTMYTSIHPEK